MIDLYTASTPNGWKASVCLEELGLTYTVHPIKLDKKEQKEEWYLKLNPNGRIPTLVDRENGGVTVFESGAILLYLAEKTGKLIPSDVTGRFEVIQWLMFQMGGVGPMQGQANVFFRYAPEKIPYAIERYQKETRRLYEVLERGLHKRDFLAKDYSIADIANWCWVRAYEWAGVSVDGLENLQKWMKRMEERPACQKGITIPEPQVLSNENADSLKSKGSGMLV